MRASQALNKLRDLSYSPEEVLKGKSVRAFAQAVFRYSQAAGLSTQHNQLTQAWTKLHPNLRRDIPEPKETTEVAEFLAHLEAKEDIWRDIENASQRRGNHQNQNRHFSMHGRPYGQRDPLVNPYQSNQGFSNQNYLPYKKYYPEHRRYHPEQQGRNQYGPPQNPPTNPHPGSRPWNIQQQGRNMPSDIKRLEDNKRVETRPPQRMISDKPAYQPNENRYANKGRTQDNRRDWNRRPTAYQTYPEEPHDASDKDLYSAQIPPDSLQDIHTENPTQEEASFNDEATGSNSPTVDSEHPEELEYACRQRNIAFPSSQLLEQGIDSLKLSIHEPKLDAITVLEFPQTLKALGMIGLLRQYVNGYAWKAEHLHEQKSSPLKNSPVKGPPRKRFAARMILDEASDPKKNESFHELQKASAKFLYHHDYGPIRLVQREREYQERVGKRSSPIESPLVILPIKFPSYTTPVVINIIFLYYHERPHKALYIHNASYVLLSFLSIFSYLFYM